jgi:hypothetical protein
LRGVGAEDGFRLALLLPLDDTLSSGGVLVFKFAFWTPPRSDELVFGVVICGSILELRIKRFRSTVPRVTTVLGSAIDDADIWTLFLRCVEDIILIASCPDRTA